MKKIEIKGKLSLNKSTIANLNNEQLDQVKGGAEGAAADETAGLAGGLSWFKKCTPATVSGKTHCYCGG